MEQSVTITIVHTNGVAVVLPVQTYIGHLETALMERFEVENPGDSIARLNGWRNDLVISLVNERMENL